MNEDGLMLRGLRAGAPGFPLKDTDRETLLHAIRAAASAPHVSAREGQPGLCKV
jgi:DNA-binding NarL/FixJ family response regulator